ncbi:MAG: GAF domain-containing protein, partial [Acidobacteriota bacterium]
MLQFARVASTSLQSTWLLRRYKQVARIGFEINRELRTIEELFEKLAQKTPRLIDVPGLFCLAVYSWQRDEATFYRHWQASTHPPQALTISGDLGAPDELMVATTAEEVATSPLAAYLHADPSLEARSSMSVPLQHRGHLLGYLFLQHPDENAYGEDDEQLSKLLANHVAMALSSIRLYRNLERLSQASDSLARTKGPAETLDSVVSAIQTATEADFVILYPFYKDHRVFRSPRVGGRLKAPERHGRVDSMHLGELPQLLLECQEPVYCRTATQIWGRLGASPPEGAGGFQGREGIASVAALSIKAGDEPAGVVFINYRKRQPFDAPQKRLIESLGIHAAAALNNAGELLRHGQRRDKELKVLQAIDKEINSTGDHRRALDLVLQGIAEVVGPDEAAIFLAEDFEKSRGEDGGRPSETVGEIADLFVASALGDSADASQKWRIPAAEAGLAGWAFRSRDSVRVDDVRLEERYLAMRPGTLSELDVPILHEGSAVGVINLESRREAAFSQEDQDFVEVLANQVLLAVRRARDVEIAKQRADELGQLLTLSRQIIGEIQLEDLLPLILKRVRENTGAQAGILLLYDEETDELVVRAELGAENGLGLNTRIGLNQGIVGMVARQRSMRNINPTHAQWRDIYLSHGEETMRSQLAFPMLEGRRCWGVLNLESPEAFKFSQREVRRTESLANMAVIALRNAEAFGQAKRSGQRLEALRNVTQEILGQTEPDAVTRLIAADAIELTGSVSADLAIYSPEGDLEVVLVWFLQDEGPHHEEFLQDIDQFREKGYLDGIMAR